MSIKDFFENEKNIQSLSSLRRDKQFEGIEDQNPASGSTFVEAAAQDRERYYPPINYSDPKNFVKFGLATQYYSASIGHIRRSYPYDGSHREKLEWHNNSGYLDNWIYENEYPRFTGHAKFSPAGWGSSVSSSAAPHWVGTPTDKEYIFIYGGPHASTNVARTADGNVYDVALDRDTNLKVDLSKGATIEFWLKKDALISRGSTGGSDSEVVFDLWNGLERDNSESFRLNIAIPNDGTTNSFKVSCVKGALGSTTGFDFNTSEGLITDYTSAQLTDGKWHHYAFNIFNNGTNLELKFYVDGAHVQTTKKASAAISSVDNSHLVATIGAFIASPPFLDNYGTIASPMNRGASKLSGSIDEFRYWKTSRNPKQIGTFYNTNVHGGTNTDDANTTLGVYYKFNESITQTASFDSRVLDYSGRVSNGTWVGYQDGGRSLDSAMTIAGYPEQGDPVLYDTRTSKALHDYVERKQISGSAYDHSNMGALYNYFPQFMRDEEEDNSTYNLKNLVQIVSQYFDEIHAQLDFLPKIKDATYVQRTGSMSNKQVPFNKRLLTGHGLNMPNLFSNAEAIEEYISHNKSGSFTNTLENVRNFVYNNIYNNLVHINKSKGTEQSIRNLLHTMGLSEDLYKINVYPDLGVVQFTDKYSVYPVKKKLLNFNYSEDLDIGINNLRNFDANAYQYANPLVPGSSGYLSGSEQYSTSSLGQTYEFEAFFPKRDLLSDVSNFYSYPYHTSSLFGVRQAAVDGADTTWQSSDPANFQVYVARPAGAHNLNSEWARFVVTSSGTSPFPTFESDFFRLYESTKWNVTLRLRPEKHPHAGSAIYGSTSSFPGWTTSPPGPSASYLFEFNAFETVGDHLNQNVYFTASVDHEKAARFLNSNKRLYVGADRQDFTGSVINYSDVRAINTRVWYDYLENSELVEHSKDVLNNGRHRPYENVHLPNKDLELPRIKTRALDWDFETVTGSDSSGRFFIDDVSYSEGNLWPNMWLSGVLSPHHGARGDFFMTSSATCIDYDYLSSMVPKLPETLSSKDMVKKPNKDEVLFERSSQPISHYVSIEKSMYQSVSVEMLKMFSSISALDNIIGDPVNRYRQEYKDLEKLRSVFFERVDLDIDFEKYLSFYKWFDSAITKVLRKFIPASAKDIDRDGDFVESHVLERNKYWNKFPTLEMSAKEPIPPIKGINEMLYPWAKGHAPLSSDQRDNCLWWRDRASREDDPISVDSTDVNVAKRDILHIATTEVSGTEPNNNAYDPKLVSYDGLTSTTYDGSTYVLRRLAKPYRFAMEENKVIDGGQNYGKTNKNFNYHRSVIKFGEQKGISISEETLNSAFSDDAYESLLQKCRDSVKPQHLEKRKIFFKADTDVHTDPGSEYQDTKSEIVLPFSVYSSSFPSEEEASGYKKFLNRYELNEFEFNNMHADTYGPTIIGAPMQGPFTDTHVGGLQYRHVRLNHTGTCYTEAPRSISVAKLKVNRSTQIPNESSNLCGNMGPWIQIQDNTNHPTLTAGPGAGTLITVDPNDSSFPNQGLRRIILGTDTAVCTSMATNSGGCGSGGYGLHCNNLATSPNGGSNALHPTNYPFCGLATGSNAQAATAITRWFNTVFGLYELCDFVPSGAFVASVDPSDNEQVLITATHPPTVAAADLELSLHYFDSGSIVETQDFAPVTISYPLLNTDLDTEYCRPEGWTLFFETEKSDVPNITHISESFSSGIPGTWQNNGSASFSVVTGSSPSVNTGPYQGRGGSSDQYLLADMSWPHYTTGYKNFTFTSPAIDASDSYQHFTASFWYHMFGQDVGHLNFDVSTNGGTTWTTLKTLAGQQQFDSGSAWKKAEIDLVSYVGYNPLYVRFDYHGGTSYLGDIGLDDILIEAFQTDSGSIKLLDPAHTDLNKARAVWYRDEVAKRPVNIKNIPHVSHSPTTLGNYDKRYQYFHSSGRRAQRRFLRDYDIAGFNLPSFIERELPETTNVHSVLNLSATYQHELPARLNTSAGETNIVERFSSPGGPEVQSRGYLDYVSEEYSPYNALPFRNKTVLDGGGEILPGGGVTGDPRFKRMRTPIRANIHSGYSEWPMNDAAYALGRKQALGLNQWHRVHAGRGGSEISPNTSPGELTYRDTDESKLSTLSGPSPGAGYAAYHKTNRNVRFRARYSIPVSATFSGTTITSNNHGLKIGQRIYIYSDENAGIIPGNYLIGGVTTNTITIAAVPGTGTKLTYELITSPANADMRRQFDNMFVQHHIPRMDRSYAWITSSMADKTYDQSASFGHVQDPSDISFVSEGDIGSYLISGNRAWGTSLGTNVGFIATDFVGLNTNILEPISSSINTLGHPAGTRLVKFYGGQTNYLNSFFVTHAANTSFANGAEAFNSLILNRQGAFGWPTWKQIRGGEHPIVRAHRLENTYSLLTNPKIIKGGGKLTYPPPGTIGLSSNPTYTWDYTQTSFNSSEYGPHMPQDSRGIQERKITNWSGIDDYFTSRITPVTSKYKPFIHRFDTFTDAGTNIRDIVFRYTYSNHLATFNNPSILEYIKVDTSNSDQLYDYMKKFYLTNTYLHPAINPINKMDKMTYRETIFPRHRYTYLKEVRGRTKYEVTFWRSDRSSRTKVFANTQGMLITGSIWKLDSMSDTTIESVTSSTNTAGELGSRYSQFHTHNAQNSPVPSTFPNTSKRVVEAMSYREKKALAKIPKPGAKYVNIEPIEKRYQEAEAYIVFPDIFAREAPKPGELYNAISGSGGSFAALRNLAFTGSVFVGHVNYLTQSHYAQTSTSMYTASHLTKYLPTNPAFSTTGLTNEADYRADRGKYYKVIDIFNTSGSIGGADMFRIRSGSLSCTNIGGWKTNPVHDLSPTTDQWASSYHGYGATGAPLTHYLSGAVLEISVTRNTVVSPDFSNPTNEVITGSDRLYQDSFWGTGDKYTGSRVVTFRFPFVMGTGSTDESSLAKPGYVAARETRKWHPDYAYGHFVKGIDANSSFGMWSAYASLEKGGASYTLPYKGQNITASYGWGTNHIPVNTSVTAHRNSVTPKRLNPTGGFEHWARTGQGYSSPGWYVPIRGMQSGSHQSHGRYYTSLAAGPARYMPWDKLKQLAGAGGASGLDDIADNALGVSEKDWAHNGYPLGADTGLGTYGNLPDPKSGANATADTHRFRSYFNGNWSIGNHLNYVDSFKLQGAEALSTYSSPTGRAYGISGSAAMAVADLIQNLADTINSRIGCLIRATPVGDAQLPYIDAGIVDSNSFNGASDAQIGHPSASNSYENFPYTDRDGQQDGLQGYDRNDPKHLGLRLETNTAWAHKHDKGLWFTHVASKSQDPDYTHTELYEELPPSGSLLDCFRIRLILPGGPFQNRSAAEIDKYALMKLAAVPVSGGADGSGDGYANSLASATNKDLGYDAASPDVLTTGDRMKTSKLTHYLPTDAMNKGLIWGRFGRGVSVQLSGYKNETDWDVGIQSQLTSSKELSGPFYDTYEEYSEHLRAIGKDYSVIPEFRISEHMPAFIDQADPKANFLSDITNFLSLTGAHYQDSSDSRFFNVYSTSDFMEHFTTIKQDHEGFAAPSKITLECKALMKFLPYDGFYPAERTAQLATLFSQSYGPSTTITGSQGNFRTALQPLFAPGIMYNTIKSGLGSAYPWFITQTVGGQAEYHAHVPDHSILNPYHFLGNPPEKLVSSNLTGRNNLSMDSGSWGVNSGSWVSFSDAYRADVSYHIPFEAILHPEEAFRLNPFRDDQPYKWSKLDSTASLSATPSKLYSLASHNFFAESIDFFLDKGQLTQFSSKAGTVAGTSKLFASTTDGRKWYFGESAVGKTYAMDVVLKNSNIGSLWNFHHGATAKIKTAQLAMKMGNPAGYSDAGTVTETKEVFTTVNFEVGSEAIRTFSDWLYMFMHYSSSSDVTYRTEGPFVRGLDEIKKLGDTPFDANNAGKKVPPAKDFSNTWLYNNPISNAHKPEAKPMDYSMNGMLKILKDSPVDDIGQPKDYTRHTVMYNSPSAFGPLTTLKTGSFASSFFSYENSCLISGSGKIQIRATGSGITGHGFAHMRPISDWYSGYHPYTPSYYNGYSRARIEFKPLRPGLYTLEEIQHSCSVDEFRFVDSAIGSTPYRFGLVGSGSNRTEAPWSYAFTTREDINPQSSRYTAAGGKQATTLLRLAEDSFLNWYSNFDWYGDAYGLRTINPMSLGSHPTVNSGFPYAMSRYKNDAYDLYNNYISGTNIVPHLWDVTASVGATSPEYEKGYFFTKTQKNAQQITDHINIFGRAKSKKAIYNDVGAIIGYEDDPEAPIKWVISTKFETPVFNFKEVAPITRRSASFNPIVDVETTAQGMWHQYGKPLSQKEGITLEIQDIPQDEIISTFGYAAAPEDVLSLADVFGFEKTSKRIGEVNPKKRLEEAVVAIPFKYSDKFGEGGTPGNVQFYEFPEITFKLAMGEQKYVPGDIKYNIIKEQGLLPGDSVQEQIEKMKKYVLPPKFDFITNRGINPFAMFIFEFGHDLNAKDVGDIWQNVTPESLMKIKPLQTSKATVESEILAGELFYKDGQKTLHDIDVKTRWLVFKVKQKAKKNYFKKTADSADDANFEFKSLGFGQEEATKTFEPPYSYNWPYDYFSMVELIKIDAGVQFNTGSLPPQAAEVPAEQN